MFKNIRDNIKFVEDNDILIFNHRTYVMLVYGVLTHYLRLTSNSAKKLISESHFLSEPKSYYEATGIMHDTFYHTAMLYAYKNLYWNNGYEVSEPDDITEWSNNYITANNLMNDIAEFLP